MPGQPSKPEAKISQSVLYFIIGSVFLAITGLVWALDAFFVYLSFACVIFFYFLGFNASPRPSGRNYSENYGRREEQKKDQDFDTLFKTFTGQQKSGSSQRSSHSSNPNNKTARVIAGIFSFMFFGFFALILAVSFFSDDENLNGLSDYDNAEMLRESGQYDSAEVYYQKALTANPQDDNALAGYGFVFFARENFDEANRNFTRALEYNPENTRARYGKGSIFFNQKNYSQSAKEGLRILEIEPLDEDGLLLTGDSYYLQNRYDSAIHFYEQGYTNGIRTAGLSHVMAYIYDTQGKLDKAIPLYQEALGYDSARTDIYKRLGELMPGAEGEWYKNKAAQLKPE
jgi:tetratricopeptide (TPR) repeat protein